MKKLPKIHIAQLNLTVGDIAGNCQLIRDAYYQGKADSAELVICSELTIIGYPPEDLIYTPALQGAAMNAVDELAKITKGEGSPALIVGGVSRNNSNLHNSIFLLDNGEVTHTQHKHHLPSYGVFDEVRVFNRGEMPDIINWRDHRIGLMICEDMWHYDVPANLAKQGAEFLICINASPFEGSGFRVQGAADKIPNKHSQRINISKNITTTHNIPLIYVNQVGGQDELVFDGGSFVMGGNGEIIHQEPFFEESGIKSTNSPIPQFSNSNTPNSKLYTAMCIGLRDYVQKNGFSKVLIGLSGGIDSALTAVVAVDALGADSVHCVMLPSPYTSQISLDDAAELASNLGVKLDNIPIEDSRLAVHNALAPVVLPSAVAEENIQSRLRGVMLMSISNSTSSLLITTGNKSEMAVGYATLYGDMCGAYSVLKDLYKTQIFELSRWRNEQGNTPVMPERIITRPPSAELRPDQKDEDSLPPYDMLDTILYSLIEEYKSVDDIISEHGYDLEIVKRIAWLLRINEYKRRQSPPGVKLSRLAFGRDRRFPLTNRFT